MSSAQSGDLVLEAASLRMEYGQGSPSARTIFEGVDIRLAPGEFVSIVGHSGVGKTTLLRCLSGLQRPTFGHVRVFGSSISSPPQEIGVVFQDYSRSLMPWMTAAANVAFPLLGTGMPRSERQRRALEALDQVGVGGSSNKYPWQLSGGMQQRVAIARTLAFGSPIMLMDEPFASVDAQTRFELEDLILGIRNSAGLSVLLVTHDIDEAVYLSDRVVVLAGSPAGVVDEITVPFGSHRDQVETKAQQQFVELRTRVLDEIRKGAAVA